MEEAATCHWGVPQWGPTGTLDNVLPLDDFSQLSAAEQHGQLTVLRSVLLSVHNLQQTYCRGKLPCNAFLNFQQFPIFKVEVSVLFPWKKLVLAKSFSSNWFLFFFQTRSLLIAATTAPVSDRHTSIKTVMQRDRTFPAFIRRAPQAAPLVLTSVWDFTTCHLGIKDHLSGTWWTRKPLRWTVKEALTSRGLVKADIKTSIKEITVISQRKERDRTGCGEYKRWFSLEGMMTLERKTVGLVWSDTLTSVQCMNLLTGSNTVIKGLQPNLAAIWI